MSAVFADDGVPAPPPDAADGPINILIVDDEPANLVVLETVLDDPSYRLVRAESADQALMALVQEEFALLVLDVRMPGMNGLELAQLVKERRKTASVPIIFLTAYYDKDQHVLEGYQTGAVDFLSKPVNAAVLRSKVAVFAELHRKSRALARANLALRGEVEERRLAEEQLRELNRTLEQRVSERTDALRVADKQLRDMMGSISDGLLMLDTDWRFTYANEEGARVVGVPVEQLLHTCIWDLSARTLSLAARRAVLQAMASRQTVTFEEFFPAPVARWLQCHCYPSEIGLSVYFLDITDRREVESRREALLEAERAARTEGERVARAKEEFLASLSHELRTPLAAILGWTSIMRRDKIDTATVHRGIDVVTRNAQALSQLVADLLDVSRIVSGKLSLRAEAVDLNRIATTASDTARPDAEAKGVRLVNALSSTALELVGDSARLHQVASNLLGNAVKFTRAGGTVTVATAATQDGVELRVSDTGEGIAPDFLPHLFERFTQADGSAARQQGGLGLGLSIAKNLVEMHGGRLSAFSAGIGQGAVFTVWLPPATSGDALIESARPADTGARAVGEIDLRDVAILLVDDHEDVLEVECRLLSASGARVTTVNNATSALDRLRQEGFDLLLSDLSMPGMDGYELIRRVRGDLRLTPGMLPAAAVTAFVRAEDRQLALNEGYQGVIQKPVVPNDMLRLVAGLLEWRDEPAGRIARAAPVVPARELRALLVEDNEELQEQMNWFLAEESVQVTTCGSAEAALEALARDEPFDLIVTDVSLPGMSGIDLARRVLAGQPDARIVFSTGYDMGGQLSELGPHVRVLLKPFEPEDLSRVVDEVRRALP
jgi:CheY-like chemotaxis protein/nitrogen-specific signal transduction histidine kinase